MIDGNYETVMQAIDRLREENFGIVIVSFALGRGFNIQFNCDAHVRAVQAIVGTPFGLIVIYQLAGRCSRAGGPSMITSYS